jgi:hypothetical protein
MSPKFSLASSSVANLAIPDPSEDSLAHVKRLKIREPRHALMYHVYPIRVEIPCLIREARPRIGFSSSSENLGFYLVFSLKEALSSWATQQIRRTNK